MTLAVCGFCGSLKTGAFTLCPSCGKTAATEDELIYALAMTDHYFAADALSGMSQHMLAGGSRQKLPDEDENHFRQMLPDDTSGLIKKLMGRRPPRD